MGNSSLARPARERMPPCFHSENRVGVCWALALFGGAKNIPERAVNAIEQLGSCQQEDIAATSEDDMSDDASSDRSSKADVERSTYHEKGLETSMIRDKLRKRHFPKTDSMWPEKEREERRQTRSRTFSMASFADQDDDNQAHRWWDWWGTSQLMECL